MRRSLIILTLIFALTLHSCEREREPYQAKSFDSISYLRPDTEVLIEKAKNASECRKYSELLKELESINEMYVNFSTMLTYLTIKTSSDTSDVFLMNEYECLTEDADRVNEALESLFIALAKSTHKSRLEKEIFGEGFFEKYADKRQNGQLTDLFLSETRLENEYRTLVSSNKNAEMRRIFTELVRVRRQIADALGYNSYTEYAYEALAHGYSTEDMSTLTKSIAKHVVPLAAELDTTVFKDFFTENTPKGTDTDALVQILENLYSTDNDLGQAYSFMKTNALFDIAPLSSIRRTGAYTVYIEGIDAPFIFMSTSKTPTDYAVLAHEFGHFYDFSVNQGERASMDLLEVSSQALELLTLDSLKSSLDEKTYEHLYFSEMRDVIYNLIYQSFYSEFEHLAYSLTLPEITEKRLSELVSEAAERMNLSGDYFNSLDFVLTDQIALEPHYSQSYAVSLIPSLEIYFEECGMQIYKSLVKRDGICDFNTKIREGSLSDVFDEATVVSISDKIYLSVCDFYYDMKRQGDFAPCRFYTIGFPKKHLSHCELTKRSLRNMRRKHLPPHLS